MICPNIMQLWVNDKFLLFMLGLGLLLIGFSLISYSCPINDDYDYGNAITGEISFTCWNNTIGLVLIASGIIVLIFLLTGGSLKNGR